MNMYYANAIVADVSCKPHLQSTYDKSSYIEACRCVSTWKQIYKYVYCSWIEDAESGNVIQFKNYTDSIGKVRADNDDVNEDIMPNTRDTVHIDHIDKLVL